jgi:TolB protein
MDAAPGSVARWLAESTGNDRAPAYSPDGRQIAFTSDRDGGDDVYVMDAKGGKPRRLTHGLRVQAQPSWSPDGRRIAFSASASGKNEVYIVQRDGSGLQRLTRGGEGMR